MVNDREEEKKHINNKAKQILEDGCLFSFNRLTQPLRAPYVFYQKSISNHANSNSLILEIGAGMGENTGFLLATGARICATDISEESLNVLKKRFDTSKLTIKVANMEKLPFENELFDVIVSAGSLTYGDNSTVLNEIYRVLKPKGVFIAVDSLNDSFIYRLNRYIRFFRKKHTLKMLKESTPNLKLLYKYKRRFGEIEVRFFGSISYLTPLLIKVFGERLSTKISDGIDRKFSIKKSAFKFVMIVTKR